MCFYLEAQKSELTPTVTAATFDPYRKTVNAASATHRTDDFSLYLMSRSSTSAVM